MISLNETRKVPATSAHQPFWRKLLWMIAIWAGSVLTLGVVATVFRLLMMAAGMKPH
ncbi:DUF2474 domain-containing protein [Pluralibacter gergoviae]|uniref:DUF2474 domain-containing protein n=1 Tax=Enterobacteriaceae TaxID=543 RepID=UPI0007CD1FC6|nr:MULTISPECIES: DUF2474 domain-containing protein [Enterobacteriaceae]EKV9911199.1 DUF2474 domain-containing protein [Pluralibacter gergoviae]SAQ15059.1 Protein of uncharacterised function (DUF2474) [Klebsiella oxytoca]HBX4002892.1 DUF2474 domain-containing protein [Klebsiella variicola]ELD4334560.1 DUF2474 domain-containing protein [Pluralibacter gergoviae]MBZ6862032.1 DUF2474 domain-containing protein [Klebsiella michiganensis]